MFSKMVSWTRKGARVGALFLLLVGMSSCLHQPCWGADKYGLHIAFPMGPAAHRLSPPVMPQILSAPALEQFVMAPEVRDVRMISPLYPSNPY